MAAETITTSEKFSLEQIEALKERLREDRHNDPLHLFSGEVCVQMAKAELSGEDLDTEELMGGTARQAVRFYGNIIDVLDWAPSYGEWLKEETPLLDKTMAAVAIVDARHAASQEQNG